MRDTVWGIVEKCPSLIWGSRLIFSFLALMVACGTGQGTVVTTNFDLRVCVCCVWTRPSSTRSFGLIMFDDMALVAMSGKEAWWQTVGNNLWGRTVVCVCVFGVLAVWLSLAQSWACPISLKVIKGQSDCPITRRSPPGEIRSSAVSCPSQPKQVVAEAVEKDVWTILSFCCCTASQPGVLCPGSAKCWGGVLKTWVATRGSGLLVRLMLWTAGPTRHEVLQGNRLLLLVFELVGYRIHDRTEQS